MTVRRVGRRALLIECADQDAVEPWRATLWQRRKQGELDAEEIVPGERTVLLDGVDPAIRNTLSGWAPDGPALAAGGPLIDIPTTFDGEDLEFVAEIWGIPIQRAIERLAGTEFTVAFSGFAPGFAYMRGLPESWAVPRLETPRPRVPAGAVALAGAYTGIYPGDSPGGWRLVGHTQRRLFDVRAEPPALLSPGTRVRLVAVR